MSLIESELLFQWQLECIKKRIKGKKSFIIWKIKELFSAFFNTKGECSSQYGRVPRGVRVLGYMFLVKVTWKKYGKLTKYGTAKKWKRSVGWSYWEHNTWPGRWLLTTMQGGISPFYNILRDANKPELASHWLSKKLDSLNNSKASKFIFIRRSPPFTHKWNEMSVTFQVWLVFFHCKVSFDSENENKN